MLRATPFLLREVENPTSLAYLYEGQEDTLILSCLQGEMGKMYQGANVKSALIVTGDFAFPAGEADASLLREMPPPQSINDCLIYVPPDDQWRVAIEKAFGGRLERLTRYAIKKEKDIFQRDMLREFTSSVPEGFQIVPLTGKWIAQTQCIPEFMDFTSQFSGERDYEKRGLGFVAVNKQQEVCGGASSYSVFHGGIEVEIDVSEAYRRKHLALCCASHLILACLQKGLYPSWDAANLSSVHLAEKLGYHLDRAYTAYQVERLF